MKFRSRWPERGEWKTIKIPYVQKQIQHISFLTRQSPYSYMKAIDFLNRVRNQNHSGNITWCKLSHVLGYGKKKQIDKLSHGLTHISPNTTRTWSRTYQINTTRVRPAFICKRFCTQEQGTNHRLHNFNRGNKSNTGLLKNSDREPSKRRNEEPNCRAGQTATRIITDGSAW
jgi:hypothetical protein